MSNHFAIVAGGTGGLGRAVCRRLADRGFDLAATYIIPEEAEILEHELALPEDRLTLRRVDCSDSDAVAEFFTEVMDGRDHLTGLVHLVGGWTGGRDVEDTDDLRFDRMIDLNLRTSFNTARMAIPHLRAAPWGRIVMIGSRAAIEPPAGQASYNLAKAGVIALARTIAQELGDSHVTSNVIMPSMIDTPAFRAAVPYADYVNWPTPAQIAGVVSFLVSEDSAVVNGAMVPVFGAA